MKNKSPIIHLITLIAISLTLSVPAQSADEVAKPAIELGAPFADNAILQRDMPLPVWGWSKPGTKVSVEFAGQKKSATAGDDGKWILKLDPLKVNAEPQQLMVSESTGKKRTLENILVGEVWMASGQSNMQWNVSKCDTGRVLLAGINARVEAGKEKPFVIREAKVTNYFAALHPIEHANVEWADGGGDSSAIAFAFAYKLHRELGVPIGILNCSFSQTAIQAWTPRVGFAGGKDDYTKAIYQKILETDPATPEHKKAWGAFYKSIDDTIAENKKLVAEGKEAKPVPTKTPGNMQGNRDASWLFNARLNPMIPYAIRGAIWNQGYANMGEGLPYYHNLHSMIRGWRKLWQRPDLPVYFHQFYCPGQKGEWDNSPSIGSTAEMRLGTWMARDIPNTGMASQIDITGAIHYSNKTLPGQRLALHALKNQYGKKVAADGPMFKSYHVKGDQVIVTLENTDGGLVVAETGTNSKSGLAIPTVIPNGADQVKLFYVAGEDRVWHPAMAKIDGNKVTVTSPKVKSPRGVSYATGGVGNQPNLYNKAMLPTTPFIYFDNKMVTSKDWPTEKLKIAGEKIDPNSIGKVYHYRKMPLLSTQFRDNAVLQAGVPVTIWGSAVHDWGHEADGKAVIKFSFAGTEKTIDVTPGMKEWQVTVPPMKASAELKTLKVTFSIDGELVHERVSKNIVIGDVYYIAAPPSVKFKADSNVKSQGIVRMISNKAKRFSKNSPSRFSVAVSTTPLNRFAAEWADATGLAAAIGRSIGSKTGNPVGIIFMQTKMVKKKGEKEGVNPVRVKSWIHPADLNMAPSLAEDYKDLGATRPGNKYYDENALNYIASWKKYWSSYVPEMIKTKRVPDAVPWGTYPMLNSSVTSDASEVYNVMTHSFTPAALKGIIFISSENLVADDQGANFGPELSVLANSFKKRFGQETHFYATAPAKSLAPKLTKPASVKGKSTIIEVNKWDDPAAVTELITRVVADVGK
ncbi:MAG: sialate O-acetylesterase [Akkermansiaceae bacterium]